MKKYSKKKSETNQPGPKYRTPSHFQGKSKFGKKSANPNVRTKNSSYRIQHRG